MKTRIATVQHAGWVLLALAGALSAPGLASAASTNMTAQERHEKERAKCMALQSETAQRACLRDADAAKQATPNTWTNPSPEQLAENARRRCEPLPADLKDACLRRMAGEGTQTGSVAGGGIFRTLTVETPGVQPETAPPTAAGPASAPQQ